VPYVVFVVLRGVLAAANSFPYVLAEVLVLMVNPLFGVLTGLGYISEVWVSCYILAIQLS